MQVSAACRLTIEQEGQLVKMLNHEKRKKFLERLHRCDSKPKSGHHLTHYHVALLEARVGGKFLVDLMAQNGVNASAVQQLRGADLLLSESSAGGGASADAAGFRYHRTAAVRANGFEAVRMVDSVFSEKLSPDARFGWLFLYDLLTGTIGISLASDEPSLYMNYPLDAKVPAPHPLVNGSAVADWKRLPDGSRTFSDWAQSHGGGSHTTALIGVNNEPVQGGPRGVSGAAAVSALPKLLFQILWMAAIKGGSSAKPAYDKGGPMWQIFSILSHAYDAMMDQLVIEQGDRGSSEVEVRAKAMMAKQLADAQEAERLQSGDASYTSAPAAAAPPALRQQSTAATTDAGLEDIDDDDGESDEEPDFSNCWWGAAQDDEVAGGGAIDTSEAAQEKGRRAQELFRMLPRFPYHNNREKCTQKGLLIGSDNDATAFVMGLTMAIEWYCAPYPIALMNPLPISAARANSVALMAIGTHTRRHPSYRALPTIGTSQATLRLA